MSDWADDIADQWHWRDDSSVPWEVAAALRKAKGDGMREAANIISEYAKDGSIGPITAQEDGTAEAGFGNIEGKYVVEYFTKWSALRLLPSIRAAAQAIEDGKP